MSLIKDWEYFALLALFETCPDCVIEDLSYISQRLNISMKRADHLLKVLERLKLVKLEPNGQVQRLERAVSTTTDIPSEDLRESHKQTLKQAIHLLDQTQCSQRDVSSMTLAIDPEKIPTAKVMIKNFRRNLMEFLEDGDQKEVYNINIQLMPVTVSEK